jgi:hypothetical protein
MPITSKSKSALMGMALAGALGLGIAQSAHAQSGLERDMRQDRREIAEDQWKLQRDVARHGFYSRQAERDRAELRHEYTDVRNDRRTLDRRYDRDDYRYRRGWDRD